MALHVADKYDVKAVEMSIDTVDIYIQTYSSWVQHTVCPLAFHSKQAFCPTHVPYVYVALLSVMTASISHIWIVPH